MGDSTLLPATPTPLLGREGELTSIRRLLSAGRVRLLTLTGPPGTGKTRLAQEAAASIRASYSEGAVWVPLAPIGTPVLVGPAIAAALGLVEEAGRTVVESLVTYLHDRHLLLVLDNLEQVLDAAPFVADLVSQCPRLNVLVTSRAPLRVRGEREFLVPPLALPGVGVHPDADCVTSYAAVDLLAQRAQDVLPAFRLTEDNTATVVEICRRLDGLPLAIELAASRLKVLSPGALLTRLEHRLPLLTSGARDMPARQQTLRNAITWSYDLLTAAEQTLFRRLGVFAGGFTLDRVEAINHFPGGPALHDVRDSRQDMAVIDRLARLVDHNLVQQTHTPDGTIRFSLLETLREFALERLAEQREVDDARRQHTLCYVAFVEEAARYLHGANQAHWHAQIEHERHNLRAAILWSVEREERQLALRLVASMWWFWFIRGYFSEGRELLAAALSIPGDSRQPLNTPELADALIGAGFLAEYHAYDSHAQTIVNRGLEVARALADPQRIALASITLGLLASHRARFAEARTLSEQALAHARAAGDPHMMAFSTNSLGHIAYREGEYSTARRLFAEALTLWRNGGDDWGTAMTLNGFGHVALAEQDYVAARAFYEQSLAIRQSLGYTAGIALSLTGLARVASGEGNITLARSLCKDGWTTAPDWRIIAAHQASTRCETALANAWATCETITLDQAIAYALGEANHDDVAASTTSTSVRPVPPIPTQGGASGGDFSLTPRQREVAILVAQGLTNRQIAQRLVISERTAMHHVGHILDKLDIHSRAQIAAWAAKHGLQC